LIDQKNFPEFFSSFLYAERFTLSAILIFQSKQQGGAQKVLKKRSFYIFFTLFAPFYTFFTTFFALFDRFLQSASFLIDVFSLGIPLFLVLRSLLVASKPLAKTD